MNASYGDFKALWEVSFKVEKEEIVALIGSNGAGKTTILKTISGLLRPFAGGITFEGTAMNKVPIHKRVEMGISLIPEGRGLFPGMSTLENLEMGAFAAKGRRSKNETLEQVYELFPVLKMRKKQAAGTLSGGEQQMLAIARALMSRPKLLLIDELSWGLSPKIIKDISETIVRINKTTGLTIVMVEQNVALSLEMADYAYILENGRIVGMGEAARLRESEQVKNAYLGLGDA